MCASTDDGHVRVIWACAWEHGSAEEDMMEPRCGTWDECRGRASTAPDAWRVGLVCLRCAPARPPGRCSDRETLHIRSTAGQRRAQRRRDTPSMGRRRRGSYAARHSCKRGGARHIDGGHRAEDSVFETNLGRKMTRYSEVSAF